MSGCWFTSDTHFTHAMVACKIRGFTTTEDHDEAIISRWNKLIRPDDVVWHLGDVGMGRLDRWVHCLTRLNGVIHLIPGNHDDVWPGHRDSHKYQRQWLEYFQSIQAFSKRNIDGTSLLLSHFPYEGDHTDVDRGTQFRLRDLGGWLAHGHTHFSDQQLHGRQIHVGLDAWQLKPVHQSVIQRFIAGDKAADGEAAA